MKIDVLKQLLSKLSKERPVFHSECDFQHEIAYLIRHNEIDNFGPIQKIRLERPYSINSKRFELDIYVEQNNERIGIELKYKTKSLPGGIVTIGAEEYHLKNHAALGSARYDFIKDISRIEQLIKSNHIEKVMWY